MSDYALEIALPAHKRGDRWVGVPTLGPVKFDGVAHASELVRVRMQLRGVHGGRFTLDSEDNTERDAPVVISDAATWVFNIPAVSNFVTRADNWTWDLEFYYAGEPAPLTYLRGVLEVYDDTTK